MVLRSCLKVIAIVLITVAAERAFAQTDSLETVASSQFLRFVENPGDGGLLFFVFPGNDGMPIGPHSLELLVDGRRVEGSGDERVSVKLTTLTPRAISVTWTPDDALDHEFELRLQSTYSTAYYGTGERFQALNHRGFSLPMTTDDRADNKGVGAYKPVPFFMSSDGYGLWVDSFSPGVFDLNASDRFVAKLRFKDDRFRVVIMAGPQFSDVLETFTGLTGRSRVLPPWAFGLWKSRDVHPNQDSVYADIDRLREYDIPASVIVLDSPWETGYNDFEINTTQFADTAAMFDRIESLGFNLALWLTPFINSRNVVDMEGISDESRNFAEAAERGYLVSDSSGQVLVTEWWKGEGGLVDFTNPDAVAWWFDQLEKTRAYGARAFKCDDGEGNFVPDAVFYDGTPARKMKNRYAALYDSVMQAYVDERLGGDGVLITRSGYSGTQKYSFDWAGDNRSNFSFEDGLPTAILAGQNAALSGIALWGSDIAGYFGRPDPELFIRWTQFGTFSPFMQVHMTSNQGPWDFGTEALEIFRDFAKLRTSLFPYLYEAVHEAARTGMPVIRPMVLAYQGDDRAASARYQYMFGPDLLVAPMYQPGTHRAVYLPEGEWVDWWSGSMLDGKQTIEVHAPLAQIPLFVRSGAMLPLLPEDVDTLVPRSSKTDSSVVTIDDRRVIQIWPGTRGERRIWGDLSAVLERVGGIATLHIESRTRRTVEVRLMYDRPARFLRGVPADAVEKNGDSTLLHLGTVGSVRTISWEDE